MTLVKTGGPWRTLRSLGVGPSDYLHPLSISPGAIDEMREFVGQVKGVDLIDLHQVRETHPLVSSKLKGSEQANCLVLDLPESVSRFHQQSREEFAVRHP